jgi:hypothetical protein
MEMNVRLQKIKFIALAIVAALPGQILALDPPPMAIGMIAGTPQPVPPLIDYGAVKPGRPQGVTQPMINQTGIALLVESVYIVNGNFELTSPFTAFTSVPSGGSFTVSVSANGEGSGETTGRLAIEWGNGLGTGYVDLRANVDVVDAMVPELWVAQSGFESGSTAPFSAPIMYPAPPVSAAAALVGSLGAALPHTASTTPSYLHFFFPSTRALARAEFRFDPNSLEIPNASPETIAGYFDYGLPIAWLEIRRFRLSHYQLRVSARLDNGSIGSSDWVVVEDAPLQLVFDWWAGSIGDYEGGVRVRCGVGCVTEHRSTGLNFLRIRNARVGAVSGVSTAAVGNAYLDELRLSY